MLELRIAECPPSPLQDPASPMGIRRLHRPRASVQLLQPSPKVLLQRDWLLQHHRYAVERHPRFRFGSIDMCQCRFQNYQAFLRQARCALHSMQRYPTAETGTQLELAQGKLAASPPARTRVPTCSVPLVGCAQAVAWLRQLSAIVPVGPGTPGACSHSLATDCLSR